MASMMRNRLLLFAITSVIAFPIAAQRVSPSLPSHHQTGISGNMSASREAILKDSGINLEGSVSATWSAAGVAGAGVRMRAQRIVNDSGSTSPPLLLRLWATSTVPASGSTIHIHVLGAYSLGELQSGFEFDNVDSGEVPYSAPAAGCYYVTVAVESLNSGGSDATYYSFRTLPDGGAPTLFSFGGAGCGGSTPGQSGVLYAVENTSSAYLFRIDDFTTNLHTTDIGNTGLNAPAIAIDPTSGVLYAIEAGHAYLYRLDTQSGLPTFIGDTSLAAAGLVALACDRQGRIFTWGQTDANLYRLDPQSGAATLIGNVGYPAGGDLAFDLDGTLYGSTGTDLIRIDPQTAASSYVGSFQTSSIFGLAVSGDGTLYAGQEVSGFFGSSGQLYLVDKATAQLTPVGGSLSRSIADLALFGGGSSSKPDLVPYTPQGWSAPIVVSTVIGTQVDSPTLTASDKLYVSWAVLNDGTAATSVPFYTQLLLDGGLLQTWQFTGSLQPNFYTPVKDYQFGPLTAGTHTVELAPDVTNTVGPSHTYTKNLTVQPAACGGARPGGAAQSCGPTLRLVATSLNIMSTNPAPTRIQRIGLQQSPQALGLAIGEGVTLKVFQVNADGSDGAAIATTYTISGESVGAPPVSSSLATQPVDLFPGRVMLTFSAEPRKLFPVHSGAASLSVATAKGNFTVPVQVTSLGYHLGTTNPTDFQGHDVDGPALGYADLHGIPPQVVKAVIQQESKIIRGPGAGMFDEMAYRYEPLGFDFAYFSAGQDLRASQKFLPYVVQTVGDSLNLSGFPEGGGKNDGINDTTRALREKFKVTLGADHKPLPVMTSALSGNTRSILPTDGPIAMENILFTNDTHNGWYTSSMPGMEPAYLKFRKTYAPFTAQTVLAASYGLMQAGLVTALENGYTTSGVLRQPSDLFDRITCIDVGTNILAGKANTLPVPQRFAHASDLRTAWADALSLYQGAKLKTVLYSGPTQYGKTVIAISDSYFPLQ